MTFSFGYSNDLYEYFINGVLPVNHFFRIQARKYKLSQLLNGQDWGQRISFD